MICGTVPHPTGEKGIFFEHTHAQRFNTRSKKHFPTFSVWLIITSCSSAADGVNGHKSAKGKEYHRGTRRKIQVIRKKEPNHGNEHVVGNSHEDHL